MHRLLSSVILSGLFVATSLHAAVTTTADLVTVVPGAPGTWTYSVGGWGGGGLVTGSFTGADGNADGQLSWFDGEVSGFTMSYSGGTIVAPLGFGFADLFGLVYDFDGDIGDGLVLDVEGIGASGGGATFAIGPGPVGLCGTGAPCGFIDGPAAVIPLPPMLPLVLAGIGLLAATSRRRTS